MATSETDFLAKQVADAKAAMNRVIGEMTRDVGQGVDPRAWVQAAPWTTLAAAAVAGFVATALAVPSKEEQAVRRLKKLEAALSPASQNGQNEGHNESASAAGRSGAGPAAQTFLSALVLHLVKSLPALVSTALTAVSAARPPAPASGSDAPASSTDASPDAAADI